MTAEHNMEKANKQTNIEMEYNNVNLRSAAEVKDLIGTSNKSKYIQTNLNKLCFFYNVYGLCKYIYNLQ